MYIKRYKWLLGQRKEAVEVKEIIQSKVGDLLIAGWKVVKKQNSRIRKINELHRFEHSPFGRALNVERFT